ncbi:MAG: MBOAT family protein [Clostridium sp.]|nr:MBOAT family protein [Clostridium sp.]
MLFNSYEFLFLFFPLTLAGLALCRKLEENFPLAGFYVRKKQVKSFHIGEKNLEKVYLLAVSLVFYGCLHPEYLPVLLGSMAVNYCLGWQMERGSRRWGQEISSAGLQAKESGRKKGILILGLVFHLGMLGVFKYADTGGFVPLGISFFTFTQIAYLMECYRGNLKEVKPLFYGLYVSFFPKIMQGPIALPGELFPQLEKVRKRFDWERSYRNLYLFVLGLSKKVLLADTLGKAVDFGYGNLAALNSGDGLIVMLSYTLQLYFDFSGYCDMAMGIAGIMGYDLPLNFDSPYKASNILEFWKRWHMTLTGFFTRYLYIPLGGNRKGRARTYVNCLIVFFLSGIWHGAGWQFVVWGLLHGAAFAVTRAWKDTRKRGAADLRQGAADNPVAGKRVWRFSALPAGVNKTAASKGAWRFSPLLAEENDFIAGKRTRRFFSLFTGIKKGLAHILCVSVTFLYVNFAWIFFRAASVKEAIDLIKIIFKFNFIRINWELAGCFNLDEFWYVIKVLRIDNWQYAHYILLTLLLLAMLLLVFFGKSAVRFVREVKPNVLSTIVMAVLFIWSVISFSGVSSFLYVNF